MITARPGDFEAVRKVLQHYADKGRPSYQSWGDHLDEQASAVLRALLLSSEEGAHRKVVTALVTHLATRTGRGWDAENKRITDQVHAVLISLGLEETAEIAAS